MIKKLLNRIIFLLIESRATDQTHKDVKCFFTQKQKRKHAIHIGKNPIVSLLKSWGTSQQILTSKVCHSINQSEWLKRSLLSCPEQVKKRGLGNMLVPVHLIWDVHHSLPSDADISLSKYANNQLRKQSDLKCVRLFLPLKICHWYIRYLLEKCLKPFLWSYLKVCWGKSENSWKLNWVCWNV